MSWTLEYDGTRKSLAYWGVVSGGLTFRSLAADALLLTVARSDGLAAPELDHGETVTLRSGETGDDVDGWTGGTVRFTGEIARRTVVAEGPAEHVEYEIAGPWRYLEELVFEQERSFFQGWVGGDPENGPELLELSTSHVVLNQSVADGSLQGTRATLAEILGWAEGDGAPLQFVSTEWPDMKIPRREQRDITCAEAIRRQLDYMDAVTWFDYTTDPPTFHVARRSALVARSAALDGSAGVSAIGLTPRDQQRVPAVVIRFEKAYQDTYGSFLTTVEDTYPDPLPASRRGWLTATVVLAPTVTNTVRQTVEVAAIDETDLDFWKEVKGELKDENEYNGLALVTGSESRKGSLPNYIIDGAVATWMNADSEEDVVTAKISFTTRDKVEDGQVEAHKVREQKISVRLNTTDVASGTYTSSAVESTGEDPAEFAGIAQSIWTDLNAVPWSGRVRIIAAEADFSIGVGNVLNLTGGNAAWETMAALVQGVYVDIPSGATELELGPNPHMSAGQIVELLRVNRTRVLTSYRAGWSTGRLGGGVSDLPDGMPAENTTEAPKRYEQLLAAATDGTDATKQNRVLMRGTDALAEDQPSIRIVQVNKTNVEQASAGKILVELSRAFGEEIRLREALVCLPDGTEQLVLVLASETYDMEDRKIAEETPIGMEPEEEE
jgi:hypothetical protein